MRGATWVVVATLAGGSLHAQDTTSPEEPEIRRAVPVQRPTSGQRPTPVPPTRNNDPEWMRRLPQAQPQTAPAVPQAQSQTEGEVGIPWRPSGRSSPPSAASTPAPTIRKAVPVPPAAEERTPSQAPTAPPTPTPPAQEDDPGTIRLRPKDGSRDEAAEMLASANSIYSRKMYEFAAMEYEKFLRSFPQAKGRDIAYFRLGESYRIEGNREAARAAYERLTKEFKDGGFFGAASYRLGEFALAEGKFDRALDAFDGAAREASDQEVRLSARYQSARCLDRLGKPAEASQIYREVAAVESDNPYRDHARLALAEALATANQKSEALEALEKIAAGTGGETLRAEAAVKAGGLAAEMGDPKAAGTFFRQALELKNAGQWRPVAVLGALRIDSTTGDFKRVAATPSSDLDLLKGDTRAEALFLVASAHKELGNPSRADALYEQLASEFPDSAFAQKSRFQKILGLYERGDPRTRKEIEAFLESAPASADRDRAALLLAEVLFNEGAYAEAAAQYSSVLDSSLSPDLKRQARYKKAWTLAQAGDAAAAEKAYTEYLELFPDASNASGAKVQRGVARQKLKNYTGANEDFSAVLTEWPEAPEREFVLQQKALVLGQQEDYAGMKATFEQLLKEFPDTSGAAQAEFMIGWAEFESKDYKAATERLERARQMDPQTFGEKAGLRLLLCHYFTQNSEALVAEASKMKPERIPREILRWLGMHAANAGDFADAVTYLSIFAASGEADPAALLTLAQAQNAIGRHQEALATAEESLKAVEDPPSKARALLVIAESKRSAGDYEGAMESASEALRLQPEGRVNAAGRLTIAEIEYARGDYDGAARAFMTIALLYDDPEITPRALQRASESYRRSNNIPEAEKAFNELRERFPDHPVGGLPTNAAAH